MADPVFELDQLEKHFGGVTALRNARLVLYPGEVHGLVGENGAGKSTLINIATGVLQPDGGRIRLDGREVQFANPRVAAQAGIAVVHQEADLFPQLSLAENMLLGRGLERGPAGLINWPATYREAGRRVEALGERFDVRAGAAGLSVGRRMLAEIATAVAENARVLFLDEPTSSLTGRECDQLFHQIRLLRDAGVSIVYVSHRLEEVLALSDRVTVMRDGATVESEPVSAMTMERMVAGMVGRAVDEGAIKRTVEPGAVRLSVNDASAADGAFRQVSLAVRAGEIVGLYGFVGAGRSELAQSLFGLRKLETGAVQIDNAPVRIASPRDAVRAGLTYLPEDRLVQGVFRGHSVRANGSVAQLPNLTRFTAIHRKAEAALAESISAEMRVRAASHEAPIGTLSGGNQQKVVFGRWKAVEPKVVILDEPTRGVDVGAKAEIHRLIVDMAAGGAAVLLISSELPEIMRLADRVVVLSEGRVTGTFNPLTDSEETVAAAAVPRTAAEADVRSGAPPRNIRQLLAFREGGLLAFIALLAGAMYVWKPDQFGTVDNFFDVLANAALPAIMAQGVMLVICAGGIDISIGSLMGLVGATAALAAKSGWPPSLCLLLAVLLGALISMAHGGAALVARIHPIIVTLAGLSIYRGVMRMVTDGREVINLPAAYRALADGDVFGIPKICYYVVGITVLIHVFLRYTIHGRRVLALGNSESAAKLIGIGKTRLTLLVFAISGALVGLTAVLHAGYYGKVQANTGEGWELRAIAAAVIGGTNILGGRGSALGTLLGAFLMALLYNILILADISAFWQQLFVGGLILIAVTADVALQRWRGGASS